MPAPTTLVTLVDLDGDEFPIALPGGGYSDIAAYRNATDEAKKLIEDGKIAPTGGLRGLTLKSVEDPHDDA